MITTTAEPRSRTMAARLRRLVLSALLVVASAGCASESWEKNADGPLGPLLPRPFGSVSVDRQPIAWAFEWSGILAGASLFWQIGYHGLFGGQTNLGNGVGAALIGGFLGGIVMALPGHLLQWLWDSIAGGEKESDSGQAPEGGSSP